MKRLSFLMLLCLLGAIGARADEATRALQSELKNQGFYYGELDGTGGPALSAALKRYQIRNGLEVTGTATAETLGALNMGGSAAAAEEPERRRSPAEPAPAAERQPDAAPKPRVDLRKKQAIVESDQRALREETDQTLRRVPHDPSIVSPPADLYRTPPTPANARFRDLYAGSPFASAPPQLQEQTLRAAQRTLAGEGFYGGSADGQPGPATQDAIIAYQRTNHLPRTGRLDLETLSVLRLMPGANSANPVLKPFTAPPRQPRTYRGIWVD